MNDLSEKEQLDELRNWWQENRAWILGGIAIGLVAIIGYRMYTNQQLTTSMQASARFEELAEAVADNDLDSARPIADSILNENGDTVYASQARLAMARLYMDQGRDADAAAVLRPLATAGGDNPLRLVGRLRLARILLYQGKPDEALELLGEPSDTAFSARFNDLIGDAHFALGHVAEAAAAYEAVLADRAAAQTVNVQLVRMKLDDLPAPGEPVAAQAPEEPAAAAAEDAADPVADDAAEEPQ